MVVWDAGALSPVSRISLQIILNSGFHRIGLITLDLKCAGARSAGNPHATCDVAGVGNGTTEIPKRARRWKRWIQPRSFLRVTAPALDPTQLLHRAVAVLERMTGRADAGIYTDRHDVHALLLFLHYFVDACHQTKEESILFPALRQAKASVQSPQSTAPLSEEIDNLLREHVEDRFLIERSQLLLLSGEAEEFAENGKALARLLSGHADHEEQYLFPLAEKILNREESDIVAMRMEHADAQFGESQKKLLVDILEELERKYVARAA